MINNNFIKFVNGLYTDLPLQTEDFQKEFINKVCVDFAHCTKDFTGKPALFEKILTESMQNNIDTIDQEFLALKFLLTDEETHILEKLRKLSEDIVEFAKKQNFNEFHINYAIYLYNRELFDINRKQKIIDMDTSTYYSGMALDVSDVAFEGYARYEAQQLKNYIVSNEKRGITSDNEGVAIGNFYISPTSHALFFIDYTVRGKEHYFDTYTEMAVWLSETIPELCLEQARDLMRATASLGKCTKEEGEPVYKYDLVIGGSRVRGDYKVNESPLDLALSINNAYLEKNQKISTNQNARAAMQLKTELRKKQEQYMGENRYLKIHDVVVYPGFRTKNVPLVQRGQDPFHCIAHRPKTSRAHGIAIPSGSVTINLSNKQITHIRPNIVDFPPGN